jgi:hypothetical protein
VQVDELWTFVQKKQARLSFEGRFFRTLGDQYAFVAIDATTTLIPHFEIGERDMVTAHKFVAGLKGRLTGPFQFS